MPSDSSNDRVPGPRRRKATGPRSKTGCVTCRIRRVKCDEQKPNCERCSSTGRTCDWVLPDGNGPRKGEPATTSVAKSSKLAKVFAPIVVPLLPMHPGSQAERSSLEFFRLRTAPQLSGFFAANFWGSRLLQSTYHNETMLHAVTAIGWIHKCFAAGDLSPVGSHFALQQFTKAVGGLTKSVCGAGQSLDVIHTCCVLFVTFECLCGKVNEAVGHINSGVKIIAEAQRNEGLLHGSGGTLCYPKIPFIPLETLTIQFVRLDTQLTQAVESTRGPLTIIKPIERRVLGFGPSAPTVFHSLEEARNSLDYLGNEAIHFDREERLSISNPFLQVLSARGENRRQSLLSRFRQWETAFSAFISHFDPTLSTKETQAAHFLRINHIMGSVLLHTIHLHGSESIWDPFTAEAREIVYRTTQIAHLGNSPSAPRKPNVYPRPPKIPEPEVYPYAPLRRRQKKQYASFTLYTGIIAALIEMVWKCRVSSVRRAAIALLRERPPEGNWNGQMVVAVGERIMQVEEEGFGEVVKAQDLPEWRKISPVQINFGGVPGQKASWVNLTYVRRMGEEAGVGVRCVDEVHWQDFDFDGSEDGLKE